MTIKVTRTEQYTDSQGTHIVCRGKLVLIKDKRWNQPNEYNNFQGEEYEEKNIPIIISETEQLIYSDKWLLTTDNQIAEINDPFNGTNPYYYVALNAINKKILTLPENFSSKHLQAIVDGKIKDGDEVLVKCEESLLCNCKVGPCFCDLEMIIKLTNNHIKCIIVGLLWCIFSYVKI